MRVLIVLLLFFSITNAELPPQVYNKWKANATLVAVIKVVDTNVTIKNNKEDIIAKAKILKIISSKEDTPKTVTIKYKKTHKLNPFIVGPAPIKTLQISRVYKVYLNKKDNYYTPAAGGQSFEVKE